MLIPGDSVKLIEKLIEINKSELFKELSINDYNLQHPNVIEISQRIDILLLLYWDLTYIYKKEKNKRSDTMSFDGGILRENKGIIVLLHIKKKLFLLDEDCNVNLVCHC